MSKKRVLVSFDWAIKRLLRNKADFDVLEGFLSELLERKVKIKQILESESNQESPDLKYNRVDVLVEDDLGELIIIEVQYEYELDYFSRMLFGTSKVITEHISKGKKYGTMRKVYSIHIVYFGLGYDDVDYIYTGRTDFIGGISGKKVRLSPIQRAEYGKEYAGDIFPEYYVLDVSHFNDVAKNTFEEWIYYLKHNEIKDDFKAQGLDKARKLLVYDQLTPEEKLSYDKNEDDKLGLENAFYSSKKLGKYEGKEEGLKEGIEKGKKIGKQEGKKEGIEIGTKKGIEKGIKIGKQKGKQEGIKEGLYQAALNAFRTGISIEAIFSFTGLTKEEVESVIQNAKL
jgi:hypothetical protein